MDGEDPGIEAVEDAAALGDRQDHPVRPGLRAQEEAKEEVQEEAREVPEEVREAPEEVREAPEEVREAPEEVREEEEEAKADLTRSRHRQSRHHQSRTLFQLLHLSLPCRPSPLRRPPTRRLRARKDLRVDLSRHATLSLVSTPTPLTVAPSHAHRSKHPYLHIATLNGRNHPTSILDDSEWHSASVY